MRFLQLDRDQRIPAAQTIWLFRETLAQAPVVESLFEQFEAYLAAHGLPPRGGQRIDASWVPRANATPLAQRKRHIQSGWGPDGMGEAPG